MPSDVSPSSSTKASKDEKMEVDDEWDGVDSITPQTSSSSSSFSKKHSKISRGRNKESSPEPKPSLRLNQRLHGPACWMVVKWDGLPYGEATFEDVDDLRNYCSVNTYARMKSIRVEGQNGEVGVSGGEDKRAEEVGIEYEQPLRDFYRREQRAPSKIHATGQKRYNRSLSTSALSAEAPAAFHSDNGFRLRDYQWDGVRWILFNWSQRRNSILADEMGLGMCLPADSLAFSSEYIIITLLVDVCLYVCIVVQKTALLLILAFSLYTIAGKTIQTAGFLQFLNEHQDVSGPFLVVAPLSTVVNWQRELLTWTGALFE